MKLMELVDKSRVPCRFMAGVPLFVCHEALADAYCLLFERMDIKLAKMGSKYHGEGIEVFAETKSENLQKNRFHPNPEGNLDGSRWF